ncbi:MAG: phosphatidylinositol-specific phospholipase C1-like protein, partial [Kordiimonadaceae bacterium]|nr:phosphatidylinositol-specific phospholipase C1-like protein [Kordiimonadaceae bacterium]
MPVAAKKLSIAFVGAASCALLAVTIGGNIAPAIGEKSAIVKYEDWPEIKSPFSKEQAMEERIAKIVASMTLPQKIGQMTQAEIRDVTPDQVRKYYLGSVLNGGGAWPQMNKQATVK